MEMGGAGSWGWDGQAAGDGRGGQLGMGGVEDGDRRGGQNFVLLKAGLCHLAGAGL